MRILAIDPGENTGFCQVDRSVGTFEVWKEQQPKEKWHLYLWDLLVLRRPDLVICERFDFNKALVEKGNAVDVFAAELVGVVKVYCAVTQTQRVMQMPSTVVGSSAFWGDSQGGNNRIRRVGLWRPEAAPHGMDAVRHFLYWDTFTQGNQHWLLKLK